MAARIRGRATRFLTAGTLCVLAVACRPAHDWVGTWRGDRPPIPGRGNDPVANTFRRVEVIIKPDGTFQAQEGGIPFSGTVSFSGDTASLKTTHVLDRPTDLVTKPITLTWQGPGRVLYVDPGGFHPDPVLLTKVATAGAHQP